MSALPLGSQFLRPREAALVLLLYGEAHRKAVPGRPDLQFSCGAHKKTPGGREFLCPQVNL